jgi:hypothetical protein
LSHFYFGRRHHYSGAAAFEAVPFLSQSMAGLVIVSQAKLLLRTSAGKPAARRMWAFRPDPFAKAALLMQPLQYHCNALEGPWALLEESATLT